MTIAGNTGFSTGSGTPQSQSIMDSRAKAAQVDTCRIINVNIDDWTVDCISEIGNKKFFDIQVSSPYFHYYNGEGMYAQPEIGALVWVCVPSMGTFAPPFVMGFQSAHDEDFDSYRGGRQSLNPGDIMFRTRDENFLILRRGGVVQIGATPTCQTIYLPLQNIIRHFAENYEVNTFGGDCSWVTKRDDQTTDGDALTTLFLNVKDKANNRAHIAKISVGSHGEGDPLTLKVTVNASGEEDAEQMILFTLDREGNVNWNLENNWSVTAKKDISFVSREGNFLASAKEKATLQADAGDALVKSSQARAILNGAKEALVTSSTVANLEAPLVNLGGQGANSPVTKGDELVTVLAKILALLVTASTTPVVPYSSVVALAPAQNLIKDLPKLLSTVSLTK